MNASVVDNSNSHTSNHLTMLLIFSPKHSHARTLKEFINAWVYSEKLRRSVDAMHADATSGV
jgi:hypothetical protein